MNPFMDLPRSRLCTSAFRFYRNSEPATERFPNFGINFKDVYHNCTNKLCQCPPPLHVKVLTTQSCRPNTPRSRIHDMPRKKKMPSTTVCGRSFDVPWRINRLSSAMTIWAGMWRATSTFNQQWDIGSTTCCWRNAIPRWRSLLASEKWNAVPVPFSPNKQIYSDITHKIQVVRWSHLTV